MRSLGTNTYREIHSQPESFAAVETSFTDNRCHVDAAFAEPGPDQVIFTGCGSSYYLAGSAAHTFAAVTGRPAQAVACSDLMFFAERYIAGRRTVVVPITRDSRTTEVRRAVERVRALPGVTTLALTCDPGSAAYNDAMLVSPAAEEKSVVMTRSFSSLLYLATLLALHVAGRPLPLGQLPEAARTFIPAADAWCDEIVGGFAHVQSYVMLGQGAFTGIAAESMNKVLEMALAYTEAYASLEYRHGPMSAANKDTLVLLYSQPACEPWEAELLAQLREFRAITAAVGENAASVGADLHLPLPTGLDSGLSWVLPPLAISVGQLLGYHLACLKGLDADQPQHLAPAIIL